MKFLLAVLAAQVLLGCRSVVDQVDPDAPCDDQHARPAGEFIRSAEHPLLEVRVESFGTPNVDLRLEEEPERRAGIGDVHSAVGIGIAARERDLLAAGVDEAAREHERAEGIRDYDIDDSTGVRRGRGPGSSG